VIYLLKLLFIMKHRLKLILCALFVLVLLTACEKEMPEPDEWRVLEWTVDGERHKASCERQGLLGCTSTTVRFDPSDGNLEMGGGRDINGSSQFTYIYIYTEGSN